MKHNFDQITDMCILVHSELRLDDPKYRESVENIAYKLHQVVRVLNMSDNNFKNLAVSYYSRHAGDAAQMMGDIEALLDPSKPTTYPDVRLKMNDDRFCSVSARNAKVFLLPATLIGDVLPRLNAPVANFEAYGDLPSAVINKLNRRSGVKTVTSTASPSTEPRRATPATQEIPVPSGSQTTAGTGGVSREYRERMNSSATWPIPMIVQGCATSHARCYVCRTTVHGSVKSFSDQEGTVGPYR